MKAITAKLRSTMAIILMAMALPPGVRAASQNDEFSLKGLGYQRCDSFVAARTKKSSEYFQFIGWLEGYLSSYNRLTPDTINVAPWQNTELLANFLAAYCQHNPAMPYVTAVDRMIAELVPHRLRASSDILEAVNDNHKVTIYREILKSVQEVLKDRGFYDGPADGLFNETTKRALSSFQKAEKLEQTGVPDQATLFYLFLKKD